MGIGEQIRKRRMELGWSQDELAKRMGYTGRSAINKLELGKSDIPVVKVKKFAEVLGVDVEYLMSWAVQKPESAEDLSAEKAALIDVVKGLSQEEVVYLLKLLKR